MDAAVESYVAAIDPSRRPLFDRFHGLLSEEFPEADVVISYEMPTYKVGKRSLHMAVWKHGLSVYGWQKGHDAGLSDRFPELDSGRGTLRITPAAAEAITDDELRAFFHATLSNE